jgi:hypothetical protein
MSDRSVEVIREFLNARAHVPGYVGLQLARGVAYGSTFWPQAGDLSKDVIARGRRQLIEDLSFRSSAKTFCLYTIDVGISVYQFMVSYDSVQAVFTLPDLQSQVITSQADPRFVEHGFDGSFRVDEMRALLDLTTGIIVDAGLQYRKVVDVNYVDSFPHPATFPVWLPAAVLERFPLYIDRDFHSEGDIWSVLEGTGCHVRDVLALEASYIPGLRVAGYLSFFESPIEVVMEGSVWELCCITEAYTTAGSLSDQPWVLAAIKPRWLLGAKEFVERIHGWCRFVGDLFPFAIELPPHGIKSSILKIRVAAYFPDEERTRANFKVPQLVLGTVETSRLPIIRTSENAAQIRRSTGVQIACNSCFISHSSKDGAFCQQLYADLTTSGVPCWMYEYDAMIGEKIWRDISRAMNVYDKVVVVLSEHSLQSGPVLKEIERALRREDIERRDILIPIRIDDALSASTFERRPELESRTIGDFCQWRRPEEYESALDKLLTSLRKSS